MLLNTPQIGIGIGLAARGKGIDNKRDIAASKGVGSGKKPFPLRAYAPRLTFAHGNKPHPLERTVTDSI